MSRVEVWKGRKPLSFRSLAGLSKYLEQTHRKRDALCLLGVCETGYLFPQNGPQMVYKV